MLVSYILCIHNGEKTLRQTLDSLLEQKNAEIEVIAVNDGSTDHSLKILQQCSARTKKIKVFTQKNIGLAASRNKGISLAKGDYIASAAQDDIYLPSKTASQLEYLHSKRSDFCFTNVNIIDKKGKQINHIDTQLYNRRLWSKPFDIFQILISYPICASTYLGKRKCHESIYWNPGLPTFADKNIYLKMFLRFKGGKVDKTLLYRRYKDWQIKGEVKKRYPLKYLYLEHRTSTLSALTYRYFNGKLIPHPGSYPAVLKQLIKLEKDPYDNKSIREIAEIYKKQGFADQAKQLNNTAKYITKSD